jgi:hypothetical protein
MALPARDYADGDPVYTFVAEDGTNTHIDSARLRIWCEAGALSGMLKPCWVPVEPWIAKKFFADNTVSMTRVLELARGRTRLTPIIYAKDGGVTNGRPDVMLVDGHHRYCLWAMLGAPACQAYVLAQAQWEPFKIAGLPSITADDLRSMPLQRREY